SVAAPAAPSLRSAGRPLPVNLRGPKVCAGFGPTLYTRNPRQGGLVVAVAQQPSRPDVYRLYIDGQWVDAASGETFENINPATGEVLGVFAKGGEENARRA